MAEARSSPCRSALRIHLSWPEAGTVRVAVGGEVDAATAPQLRLELLQAIRRRPREIEVDLSATSFMDCAGISVLVNAHHKAAAVGCRLRLSHPTPSVRLVLDVFQLVDLFGVRGPIGQGSAAGGGDDRR